MKTFTKICILFLLFITELAIAHCDDQSENCYSVHSHHASAPPADDFDEVPFSDDFDEVPFYIFHENGCGTAGSCARMIGLLNNRDWGRLQVVGINTTAELLGIVVSQPNTVSRLPIRSEINLLDLRATP